MNEKIQGPKFTGSWRNWLNNSLILVQEKYILKLSIWFKILTEISYIPSQVLLLMNKKKLFSFQNIKVSVKKKFTIASIAEIVCVDLK